MSMLVSDDTKCSESGETFASVDRQLSIEFGGFGEFTEIDYYGNASLTSKYCTYYFTSEHKHSHDMWLYLAYAYIEGVKYLEDESVSLAGQGRCQ